MFIFNLTDVTGATSGLPHVRVYDSRGRLKGFGGTPIGTVAWGSITGLVTNQTDLINYLNLNYYPLSSNPAGYLTDAPSDGSTYGRNNGAWAVVSGSGTLLALPFTTDHLAVTNNQYVVGDVVWYSGNVYRCIANNDSILPTSPLYWTSLGAGFPLVQQPSDWNSTSGNNQILNKPTIPSVVPAALTKTDDTNVTLTLGGTPTTALLEAVSLTLGWSGVLATSRGGTGLSAIGTSLQYLRVNSGATGLEYATFPTIPTVTPSALTKTDDTNVTLTLGGTPATALLEATSLTLGWTGELSTSRGGTGLATIGTDGQLIRVNTGATALEYFTPTYLTAVPNLQAVLIAGATLTQNNTVLGANFNFTWDGFNRYTINTDEYVLLNSTSGSKIASVSVNTLGVAPYVDINTKNGSDITGFYVDTTQMWLRTPGVDAATVSNGYVLTLTDVTSGKVEFQIAPTGGDSLSPLLLMGG
jgi:hypothetical protein